MEDILKNIFEIAYKEFKDYEIYFKAIAPEIKEKREQFTEFVVSNKDNIDLLAEKLFENDVIPEMHKLDLINLQNRLIYTYETVKDVLEIPAEIKTEIEAFIKPKQVYLIQAGEAKELDPEHTKKIKTSAKEHYKIQVEKLIQQNGI